jgi:hypothetical protein
VAHVDDFVAPVLGFEPREVIEVGRQVRLPRRVAVANLLVEALRGCTGQVDVLTAVVLLPAAGENSEVRQQ